MHFAMTDSAAPPRCTLAIVGAQGRSGVVSGMNGTRLALKKNFAAGVVADKKMPVEATGTRSKQ
jgi:hypothetical protein